NRARRVLGMLPRERAACFSLSHLVAAPHARCWFLRPRHHSPRPPTMKNNFKLLLLATATSFLACSSPSTDGGSPTNQNIQFSANQAQYLLESYGSGNPDTGVDEWDVALVSKDGAQFVVARGYKDGLTSEQVLDPTKRTAVIDVV